MLNYHGFGEKKMANGDKVIHREAKYGHSLCGEMHRVEEMTLDDDKVTCLKCIRILEEIKLSDTKTKLLRKYFQSDE